MAYVVVAAPGDSGAILAGEDLGAEDGDVAVLVGVFAVLGHGTTVPRIGDGVPPGQQEARQRWGRAAGPVCVWGGQPHQVSCGVTAGSPVGTSGAWTSSTAAVVVSS